MGDFAVFTPEVAYGLLARGFKLRGMTNKAWFFDDTVSLRRAVEEIINSLSHS